MELKDLNLDEGSDLMEDDYKPDIDQQKAIDELNKQLSLLMNISNQSSHGNRIRHLSEQMMYSYSFKSVLDFLTGHQLLQI